MGEDNIWEYAPVSQSLGALPTTVSAKLKFIKENSGQMWAPSIGFLFEDEATEKALRVWIVYSTQLDPVHYIVVERVDRNDAKRPVRTIAEQNLTSVRTSTLPIRFELDASGKLTIHASSFNHGYALGFAPAHVFVAAVSARGWVEFDEAPSQPSN